MNRRNFLKRSALGVAEYSMLGMFLSRIIEGYQYRAFAQTVSGTAGYDNQIKLINICLNGAPARWYFDSPSVPDGNFNNFRYNDSNDPSKSMLITKLDANSDGVLGYQGRYATHQIGGIHFPYLWSGKIATPGTGFAPMENIAQNMACLRGMSTLDGHFNLHLPICPPSGPTLSGLLADRSQQPFPAVGFNTVDKFHRSSRGISLEPLPRRDPIYSLFQPLILSQGETLVSSSGSVGEAMDRTLEILSRKSGSSHPMLPNSFEQRLNAKRLMTQDYTNLKATYTSLFNKYKALMNRSFGDTSLRLAGVDDLSINNTSNTPHPELHTGADGMAGLYNGSDLATMLREDASINYLAESMAIAEFMMTGGGLYTRSFSSFVNIVLGVSVNNAKNSGGSGLNLLNVDAHQFGSYTSLVFFARYYRALASCIYELIQQLKSKNSPDGKTLFEKTVIALTSEFSRDAGADTSRFSDHGIKGANISLISGMIQSPMVLGNIKVQGSGTNKNNSWGEGAPVDAFDHQVANYQNAISTMANMLEIPSPTPNHYPFMVKHAGKMVSATGVPKNVA